MERQELLLVGVLTLQQQLFGATRRQRDAGGGEPAAEAPGRAAGLWQQLPLLSRCHELAAHPHIWNLLSPARRTHLHDLEQVHHDPFGAPGARLCGRGVLRFPGAAAAAAADGSVPTGVTLFDGDEDLPLRKGPGFGQIRPAPPPSPWLRAWPGIWKSATMRPSSALSSVWREDLSLSYGKATPVFKLVPLVRSHPVSHESITGRRQGPPAVPEGRAEHLICTS